MRLAKLALCALAAWGAASPSFAQDIRFGLGSAVTSIDPHFTVLGSNSALARNAFDGLVNQGDRQELVPGLAISWRATGDTSWEFELRPNVRFHDGSPFTAEDVLASLRRIPTIRNSPSSFLPFVRPIRSVQALGSHRVRIETNGPYPLLPAALSRIAIVPARFETATLEDFNAARASIGTGPYRLASFAPGEAIKLSRFDGHWGGRPRWANVEFRIVPADAPRVAALRAGDLDVIENVPTLAVGQLRREGRASLATVASNRIMYIHLDSDRAQSPFVRDKAGNPGPNHLRDPRVRRALSLAIDRHALVERIMDGEGMPAGQLVPEGYFGHVPDLPAPRPDLAAARRLLSEAGVPDGFRLTFHAPNDRYPNDEQMAVAMAAMFGRIGVETNVIALPASVYFTRASALEFSFILGGAAAETGEASGTLRPLLATFDSAKGNGTGNRGRWSNARFDALLEQALATVDDAARERLLREATRIGMEDLGVIPLFFLANTWAARPGFAYRGRSDGYSLAENADVRR